MDNTIINAINNLYKKNSTFYSKYGYQLIIAMIIIYIFLVWTAYYYVINHLPILKANWPANKCNPLYIPFAGMIINDPHKSKLDIIDENFQACVQNILTSIIGVALKPIYYITNVMTTSLHEMTDSVTGVRAMFSKMRDQIENITESISGRTLNITMPVLKLIIAAKNMVGQTVGIITTGFYTLLGNYLLLNTLLGSIIEFIGIILGIIAAAIVVALFIPFVGEIIAAPLVALEAAILIPFVIIVIAVNKIFHSGYSSSPVSACFGKNTKIQLENDTKLISEVEIGDLLHDGSVVTGLMKMSSSGQSICNLNGIIVTGLHRVYHDTVGWVKVIDHPQSYQIYDYRETIVYCLNTNTKVIKINDQTFTDWDDLDDNDFMKLNKCNSMVKHMDCKDIHPYLDNGFEENTMIEMEIGTQVKIKDIEINDILRFGERVLGVIKIDAKDVISINEYCINNTYIKCSGNIQIYTGILGNLNTDNLEGSQIIVGHYLYQLITDKGYFYINDLKIYDYNFGIEKYLANIKSYSQNLCE